MPPLAVLPVNQRRMLRHSVIPDNNRPLLPLDARLEVRTIREMVIQELENRIRLLLLEADNVTSNYYILSVLCSHQPPSHPWKDSLTLRVHINRLLARRRMRPNDRMLIHHRLAPLNPPPRRRRIHLLDPRVRRLQPVQPLPKQRTQPLIRLRRIHKQGIPARLRLVEDVQKRRPRRLLLVRHIRVPRHGTRAVRKELVDAVVARTAVHEVHLGEALGRARGRVDVVSPEVGAVVEGVFDGQVGEVLAAEGDDLALGDEARELVFASGGEAGELYAADFGLVGVRGLIPG